MRKKLFTLLLLMLTLPSSLRAYDFMVGGLCYNYTNGSSCSTVYVTYQNNSSPRYTNLSGATTIPPTVTFNGKTYSVTSIGDYAFQGCTGLTSVTIPNSVTTIDNHAFRGCSRLTSVTIPNSVTSIGIYAFYACTGLTSVTIPNSVTSIGWYAFSYCSGLTSVTIPNSVTTIDNSAFSGCTGLTSVTIPNSVTSIGQEAFSGCTGLTSVSIGNSVRTIPYRCFFGCSGLTSVTIPNSVTSIDNCAFYDCSGLTSVTIPNSVTSIGEHAFYRCSGLTSVTIPNSVTEIGFGAFWGCSSLTSVTIPNSVTQIGGGAFSDCRGLTSMVVEAGNTKYDSRNNCNAIIETATNTLISGCKNSIIPNSVTKIGSYAFYGCTGLTSVTIPNSVTSIGSSAFYGCSRLTSVTIPDSVTTIGSYAFQYCSGLTKVNISDIAAWCNISFYSYDSNPLYYAHNLYLNGSKVTNLVIPNSVTTIKQYTFYKCSGLTSVTIPNSVTEIGIGAFLRCSGLTSVTIPNSVTSIGNSAFSGCTGLTSVTIGNSVTSIGDWAFYGCNGLSSVISLIENPNNVVLGYDCFYGIPDDCLLYVLNSSYSYYFYANVWKDFNIVLLDDIKPIIEKVNHVRGERFVKVTIPFNMNNYDDISGFQFDITLPEGMSIATDGDGVSSVWLNSDRKARNHSIDVSQLFENTYRVLASSPTNNKFKGNDGVVMYLEVAFSREHPIGNYNVYIDNIELVAPDETKYRGLGTSIAVDYWYLLGDADCDARVDVADYTVTALHILNRPVDVFYSDAANVNRDNQISVADLAGIVNIALGIRDHEYYQAPSVSHGSDQTAPATPSLKATLEGDNVVMLGLDNDIPLAGLQLDIQLPQGMTVTEASLEGRAAKYQLSTSTLPDGIVRVLISYFSDEDIETGDDTVLKLVLDGNNENGDMLYMTGAQAVSRNLTTYYIENISLPIATTSINPVNNGSKNLKVYGLGNTIIVDSPSDMHIQVVNVNGMMMPVEVKAGHNIIEIGGHGVYIIRVGNSAYKVRL